MRIELLGKSFTIHADEEPGYLTAIVEYYKKQVGKIQQESGSKDAVIIAILAGILTTDELHKCKHRLANHTYQKEWSQEASEITSGLIESIDESIQNYPIEPETNPLPPTKHPSSGTEVSRDIPNESSRTSSDIPAERSHVSRDTPPEPNYVPDEIPPEPNHVSDDISAERNHVLDDFL